MLGIEFIAKLCVIDEFAREQTFDALAPPLRWGARSILCLTGVLGAHGSKKAIAERRLLAEEIAKG